MSRDPITALDEAIAGLESELAANPRFVLLQSLKVARAAFPGAMEPREKPAHAAASDVEKPTRRQMSPARQQALEISEEMLRQEGPIIKSKDIYARVEANGVELAGGANNLASLLGRFPEKFKSHGRQGWSLTAESNEASNGHAVDASEAGEVAASPNESRQGFMSLAG